MWLATHCHMESKGHSYVPPQERCRYIGYFKCWIHVDFAHMAWDGASSTTREHMARSIPLAWCEYMEDAAPGVLLQQIAISNTSSSPSV